jgi:hypothetical protein
MHEAVSMVLCPSLVCLEKVELGDFPLVFRHPRKYL